MQHCRTCAAELDRPVFEASAPAITSIMTSIDMPTRVYICRACGHIQGPDLPDLKAFYDTEYRISLESESHDQIFSTGPDGKPIYRTDHQTAISLRLLDLPQGASLLDYGAAKADTLRKMVAARADVVPYVFDVSSDYAAAWQGWVPAENQATYELPEDWLDKFDAVMSHFVIEHVAEPVLFLKTMASLTKPGGRLLLSFPDVVANPGDMAVVDHLNHFTLTSLREAFRQAGLTIEEIDRTSFPGAFCVTATLGAADAGAAPEAIAAAVAEGLAIARFWEEAGTLVDRAADAHADRVCAIYGAGFYGSWIANRLAGKVTVAAFIDQNPGLQGKVMQGAPVVGPAALAPQVEVVFVGLNPLKARAIISGVAPLQARSLDYVWLADQAAA